MNCLTYYKSKYFELKELVHPQIIRTIGTVNAAHRLNPNAVADLDLIYEHWLNKTGKGLQINILPHLDSRGLRPPNDPDGSFYSLHKQGCAFDLDPIQGSVYELWREVVWLIENEKLRAINCVEHMDFTPTWVHVAAINAANKLTIIRP